MSRYASQTQVSTDKSRAEIERILRRYGATAFGYGWEEGRAVIQFDADGRRIRFVLPMPPRTDFQTTPSGRWRYDDDAIDKAWEQAQRQRWRALTLAVKAKLEAVESGIASFEEEFLPYIVLPDGQTVGSHVLPRVAEAYQENSMPRLLPESTS